MIGEDMQDLIIDIMNQFGYLGIFLLILIENLFPPIPSEVILTFGGFMTTRTELKVLGVILVSTLGSIAGAIVLYMLGRILDVNRLEKLFDSRLGRILRLKKEDVGKAEKWFLNHGNKTVFLCRFVPIVRSFISIPAGCAKMKFPQFISLTALGTLVWNSVLVVLGRVAGDAWAKIAEYMDIYTTIAVIAFAVIAVVLLAVFVKKRFLQNDRNSQTNASADK